MIYQKMCYFGKHKIVWKAFYVNMFNNTIPYTYLSLGQLICWLEKQTKLEKQMSRLRKTLQTVMLYV